MRWWKSKKAADTEGDRSAMERADDALANVSELQLEARGALFYLKREAESNHFSRDFIAMIERGRPS